MQLVSIGVKICFRDSGKGNNITVFLIIVAPDAQTNFEELFQFKISTANFSKYFRGNWGEILCENKD